MRTKIISILLVGTTICCASCGGNNDSSSSQTSNANDNDTKARDVSSYDPKRGEGKFDETNVTVGAVDAAMADKGKTIAETKCFSCHKTSSEKLVGPGWKGVTTRHSPHWIMNFITNPDPMIDKDPEVQAQLELCLVRMPNQNLQEQDARNILEFMRANDGAQ